MARMKASLDFAKSGELHMLDYKKIAKSLESLLQIGDTVTALTYLNPLTKSIPVFTEGYVLKIKILVSKQDWKNINNEIDKAIGNRRADVSHRDQSYLLTVKAITSGRGNRYEEAIIKLNEAIEYDKLNALAFLERGKILLATGKNNKAINDLKRALSLGEGEAKEILSGLDVNR
jgi:tetratricopeptide (TPR) repeat protein